jgi:hypothetical protein
MRVRVANALAKMVYGVALVTLGFAVGRSSVGSTGVGKRSTTITTQAVPLPMGAEAGERRWLPLEWNGYRKPVAYKHMYFSRAKRR